MKGTLRIAAAVLLIAGVGIGVLYLAVPASRSPDDGPADPILAVRRPVLTWLRDVGVVDEPVFIAPDPWLPSGFSSETDAETMTCKREPVFRGLFWPVGMRITVRLQPQRSLLRLSFVEAGQKIVSGEGVAQVTGFVPRSATGYLIEELDQGLAQRQWSWGDTGPH